MAGQQRRDHRGSGRRGLTASGWSGRFIEFARLRDFPDDVTVGELEGCGIHVVSMDRDAVSPRPEDRVDTKGWLRPRLLGHRAVVPVLPSGKRESGSIEQDADVVIFIHREDLNYSPEDWSKVHDIETEPYPRGIADIIIAKHRNGPLGQKKATLLGKDHQVR